MEVKQASDEAIFLQHICPQQVPPVAFGWLNRQRAGFEADRSMRRYDLAVKLSTVEWVEWKLLELVITHLREPQALKALWGGGLGILGNKGSKCTRGQRWDLSLQSHPKDSIETLYKLAKSIYQCLPAMSKEAGKFTSSTSINVNNH